MNRDNFLKLADFLSTVPDDDPAFDLGYFFNSETVPFSEALQEYLETEKLPKGCFACALGHGPAAGIANTEPRHAGNWSGYFLREFMGCDDARADNFFVEEGPGSDVYRWCFDEDWSDLDNTARGAAARIYHMLAGRKITDPFTKKAKRRYQHALPAVSG